MKQVAKLIVVDDQNKHLVMYRGDHPKFGRDPDIPGGTAEIGESPLETMLREVYEEAGIVIGESEVKHLYSGTEHSERGTRYSLFIVNVNVRPEVVMSWEHSAYEWIDRSEFLERAKSAKDTYMHMVYDVLK